MRKHSSPQRKEISLPLDSRNRVCLSQFLPRDVEVTSYKAYQEGEKIILEPMAEVPAHEAWLYNNPEALGAVLKGLKEAENGKTSKLDFDLSQFLEPEDDEV